LIVGLSLTQPHLCYRRFPKTLLFFGGYLGTFFVLGLAHDQALGSLTVPIYRLMQMLLINTISFNLLHSTRLATVTLWSLITSCTVCATRLMFGLTTETFGVERISSTGQNPNLVSAVLALGLIALAGLAYGRNKPNRLSRLVFIAFSLILITAIVRTGSRGSA